MSHSLASKSASAAQPEGPGAPLALPVAPGSPAEAAALHLLLARARAAGLGGARIHGFAGRAWPNGPEVVHAGLGLAASAVGWVWLDAGLVLFSLAALSAGARCLGLRGAGALLPRVPCASLVLRARTPRTRRVVAAALDRGQARPPLRWAMLAGMALATGALWAGPHAGQAAALLLAGVGAAAFLADRAPRPRAGAPEVAAVEAVLAEARRLAAAADEETAVVVSACSAAEGDGVAAFCHWWDLRGVEVWLVGGGADAVAALGREGLGARAVDPGQFGGRA